MKNTIKTAISFSAALCVGLGLTSSVAADTLYVPDAIFDGASAKLIKGKAVLVSNGKIKAIDTPQKLKGEGVEVIDLSGHTLMPGLIELHSHVLLHPYDEVNWNDQV
ncbi:MAG: amidohydrolase family protein, partial [Sphingomonadales bacterium]|nr:amidohydrolase family protein [Sphingomonadales bacterium]